MGLRESLVRGALCIVFLSVGISANVVWRGPSTMYVGFPGITTELYAFLSKYSTYFISRETGEIMRSNTLDIVQPESTHVVHFPEVVPFQHCYWWQRCWNSFWRRGVWARQTGLTITGTTHLWNSVAAYGVHRWSVSLGGNPDMVSVEALLSNLHDTLKSVDPRDRPAGCVWLAYSRGVTALLRYLSLAENSPILPQALILEGGIDEVPHFLSHFFDTHLPRFLLNRVKPAWLIKMLIAGFKWGYAPQYQDTGMNIQRMLERVPDDIPILLVASKGDELVSYRCMVRIYDTLKTIRTKRGKIADNVHLLLLERPRHSYYVNGVKNADDRELYEYCVHAFYEKYNFAYDVQKAAQGQEILDSTTNIDVAALLGGSPCKTCSDVCLGLNVAR